MEINNLKLPEILSNLIIQNNWMAPKDLEKFFAKTNFNIKYQVDFFSVNEMKLTAKNFGIASRKIDSDFYKIKSSKLEHREIHEIGYIDIEKAINIIGNFNEEVICLDYRISMDEPRLVCCSFNDTEEMFYRFLSPNLETFLDEIDYFA